MISHISNHIYFAWTVSFREKKKEEKKKKDS